MNESNKGDANNPENYYGDAYSNCKDYMQFSPTIEIHVNVDSRYILVKILAFE